MDKNIIALLIIGVISLSIFLHSRHNKLVATPLPPGPKGLPLLGNVTDLPQTQPWETFAHWGEKYGTYPRLGLLKHLNTRFKEELCMSAPWENPSLCSTM